MISVLELREVDASYGADGDELTRRRTHAFARPGAAGVTGGPSGSVTA